MIRVFLLTIWYNTNFKNFWPMPIFVACWLIWSFVFKKITFFLLTWIHFIFNRPTQICTNIDTNFFGQIFNYFTQRKTEFCDIIQVIWASEKYQYRPVVGFIDTVCINRESYLCLQKLVKNHLLNISAQYCNTKRHFLYFLPLLQQLLKVPQNESWCTPQH